jgi:CRISPR-associated protein Cas2
MNCLLIYDIPDNRIRAKVADMCMDYGMNRIQYSAFVGDLQRTHQQELVKRAVARLGKKPGKVYLYCIGQNEWLQRLEHVRLGNEESRIENRESRIEN